MSLKVYLDWDENFYKGDYIELPCIVNADTTDWNIRVTVEDDYGNQVKLASSVLDGGSSDEIEIIQQSGSFDYFTIKIPYDATKCFIGRTFIEVEKEDDLSRKVILSREIKLKDKLTDWDSK